MTITLPKIKTLIYSLLLYIAAISASYAEQAEEYDHQEMAQTLAECGGVFNAMGVVLKDMGKKGAKLYWNSTNSNLTTTASGNTLVGVAEAASASGDATVPLLLNVGL